MSVRQFTHLSNVLDPDTLTVIAYVYDRACSELCSCRTSAACDAMSNRLIEAAMKGERDPDNLWRVAVNAH